MKNRLLVLVVSTLLLLAAFIGMASAQTDVTVGLFEYIMRPEGMGEYLNYIHFYDTGVYYFSAYNDQQYSAGFYEILDEPIEYPVDKAEPDGEKATADKTIVFYDFSGEELARCGYANDSVYFVPFLFDNTFVHNVEADNSPANETGVAVQEFMIPDDDYSMLLLKHNGTFEDSVGAIIEGTWTVEDNVYTLVDADTGESYTLTVNGSAATYVGLDGETYELVSTAKEALVTFTGTYAEASYGEMVVTVECYDDGSAKKTIAYAGQNQVEEGTWEQLASYNIALTFADASYEAVLNMSDYSHSFDYTTTDGVADITLTLVSAAQK